MVLLAVAVLLALRDFAQAKRHMWGIEEAAWVLSLFSLLRFKTWARMLQLSASQARPTRAHTETAPSTHRAHPEHAQGRHELNTYPSTHRDHSAA